MCSPCLDPIVTKIVCAHRPGKISRLYARSIADRFGLPGPGW
jgi:hypothetical protein